MADWKTYQEASALDTIIGTLLVLHGCYSPQLDNSRDIFVHLPDSYTVDERRYPVIYMHDGQNLFDPHTSYAGEWGIDEAMAALDDEALEAIIVGIPNSGTRRLDEYSPFVDDRLGGGDGDAYLSFIIDTVKPMIDADFRTRPERAATGMMGASMGGLISLFAMFEHPAIFSFAGVMSPSLWFAQGAIFHYLRNSPFVPGRIALDIGTGEAAVMVHDARRLHELLLDMGYQDNQTLRYFEDHGAGHNEAAWGARVCDVLRFLLRGVTTTPLSFAAD